MLQPEYFFDLKEFAHRRLFVDAEFVWQALIKLKSYFYATLSNKLRHNEKIDFRSAFPVKHTHNDNDLYFTLYSHYTTGIMKEIQLTIQEKTVHESLLEQSVSDEERGNNELYQFQK